MTVSGDKALIRSNDTNAEASETITVVELPPILAGMDTPEVSRRVESFCFAVAEIFERWLNRSKSEHTRRAYRQDVMAFVEFMRWRWPNDAPRLFHVSVADVQAWRDDLVSWDAAPKTINRRISSLSGFFKFLGGVSSELRLPITIPNPAHAQFIPRESTDPVQETKALTLNRARQLMGLPIGESPIAYRDRAILRFFLYSGARLATACRLKAEHFHQEDGETTIRIHEKGSKTRPIGLHFTAGEAITEYMAAAGITSGPLFRPQANPRNEALANRHMTPTAMYLILMSYLEKIPGAMKEYETADGDVKMGCMYSPHSLRATTATLLLDAGVDIRKVQKLLGHRHVTTTQIYDKRRVTAKESASHEVPI